jgi:glutamate/tyrosine decarboxylase-like PLP-dependent enzyme
MLYGSSETHNCLIKGVEVIGIGSDNFRKIPVDENYRIRVDLLQQMIIGDRKAGHLPFCIVGNAGTVNTGSIDDLAALSVIAKNEKLWFHIDGAFGAIPKLLPEFDERLNGLEAADSLSFDFHKWLYMNYEVGCVLFKDAAAHRNAFSSPVNYLAQHERGLSSGPEPFSNYGMELSRGFKALKVWMLLKEHGIQKYTRLVRQNLDQAQYLGRLIGEHSELELLAGVPLNIVCYRYNPRKLAADEQLRGDGKRGVKGEAASLLIGVARQDGETEKEAVLNELNKEILMRLQEEGIASPSYTVLNGRYVIRVAITNHRSVQEDFDILVRESIRIGNECARLKGVLSV